MHSITREHQNQKEHHEGVNREGLYQFKGMTVKINRQTSQQ